MIHKSKGKTCVFYVIKMFQNSLLPLSLLYFLSPLSLFPFSLYFHFPFTLSAVWEMWKQIPTVNIYIYIFFFCKNNYSIYIPINNKKFLLLSVSTGESKWKLILLFCFWFLGFLRNLIVYRFEEATKTCCRCRAIRGSITTTSSSNRRSSNSSNSISYCCSRLLELCRIIMAFLIREAIWLSHCILIPVPRPPALILRRSWCLVKVILSSSICFVF